MHEFLFQQPLLNAPLILTAACSHLHAYNKHASHLVPHTAVESMLNARSTITEHFVSVKEAMKEIQTSCVKNVRLV